MSSEELKVYDPELYRVRCNLCNREMYMNTYESHYDKCLMITTLLPILKNKGENVDYNSLDKYDKNTLEKVVYKYIPINKEINYARGNN